DDFHASCDPCEQCQPPGNQAAASQQGGLHLLPFWLTGFDGDGSGSLSPPPPSMPPMPPLEPLPPLEPWNPNPPWTPEVPIDPTDPVHPPGEVVPEPSSVAVFGVVLVVAVVGCWKRR